MGKKVRTKAGEIELDENGVVYCSFFSEIEITVQHLEEIVEQRIRLSKGIPRPVIADISKTDDFSFECLQFLGQGKGAELVTAGALIVDNQKHNFIAKSFSGSFLSKSKDPFMAFTNKEDAQKWIKDYLNKQ